MDMKRLCNYAALALATFTVVAGCGGEPFSFVPVSGKVTYSDGSPIPGGPVVVRFVPIEPKRSGKDVAGAATGYVTGKDGAFPGVSTRTPLDGVVPGWYKVMVIGDPSGRASFQTVPAQYTSASTTPLKVEVTASNRYFLLKVEKPQ
jgi:hypothetical protein